MWRCPFVGKCKLLNGQHFLKLQTRRISFATWLEDFKIKSAICQSSLIGGNKRTICSTIKNDPVFVSDGNDVGQSMDDLYRRGVLLLQPNQPATTLRDRSTAEEVLADINAVRKSSKPRGSKADFERAKKYREDKLKDDRSSNSGVVVSSSKLKDSEEEVRLTREANGLSLIARAAELGHAEAMCFLGNRELERALDSTSLAPTARKAAHALGAKAWYEKASLLGCAEASFNLGVLLHDGVQVEPPQLMSASQEQESGQRVGLENPLESEEEVGGILGMRPLRVSKVSHRRATLSNAAERVMEENGPVRVLTEDLALSLAAFELAAAQGDSAARLRCGHCFSTGEGGAEGVDVAKALQYLTQATEDPSTAAKAHFYLAQMYRSGLQSAEVEGLDGGAAAVKADEAQFLLHLRSAVDGLDEDAQHALADLHLQRALPENLGVGVGAGEEGEAGSEVVRSFLLRDCEVGSGAQHECDHGHAGACKHHAHDLQINVAYARDAAAAPAWHLQRAVALLRASSAAGQAEATLTLGALAYRGLVRGGIAKGEGKEDEENEDPKRRAFELYGLAAEQGSLQAWRNIASMHFLGDGVPRCEKTAREIMRVVFGNGVNT